MTTDNRYATDGRPGNSLRGGGGAVTSSRGTNLGRVSFAGTPTEFTSAGPHTVDGLTLTFSGVSATQRWTIDADGLGPSATNYAGGQGYVEVDVTLWPGWDASRPFGIIAGLTNGEGAASSEQFLYAGADINNRSGVARGNNTLSAAVQKSGFSSGTGVLANATVPIAIGAFVSGGTSSSFYWLDGDTIDGVLNTGRQIDAHGRSTGLYAATPYLIFGFSGIAMAGRRVEWVEIEQF